MVLRRALDILLCRLARFNVSFMTDFCVVFARIYVGFPVERLQR